VADVLVVTAFEFGDPMAFVVSVESDNFSLHPGHCIGSPSSVTVLVFEAGWDDEPRLRKVVSSGTWIVPRAVAGARTYNPLGSVDNEAEPNDRGERTHHLAGACRSRPALVLNRLKTMRGPGESYSDVILRLASAS
jgi:hypothetical protein